MTPSAALAAVIVDELARCGVRDVVLCPGSRSAPLAYALLDAVRAGRLRLHVRVDERSAGFLALGLGKANGVPTGVVTTSGTAVANLHPAVLEAHEAGVPLLLLTADRPPELQGTRANQTTDQAKLFGTSVRWFHDLGAPERRAGQQAAWRTSIDRAVAAAVGALGGDPGPVQLNVPLRDPLAPEPAPDPATDPSADPTADPSVVPAAGPSIVQGSNAATALSAPALTPSSRAAPDRADDAPGWPEPLAGRPDGAPWTQLGPPRDRAPVGGATRVSEAFAGAGAASSDVGEEPRTVLVLGDLAGDLAAGGELSRRALALAADRGWPVVAEPFGIGDRPGVMPHGPLVLSDPDLLERAAPRRILLVGRVTLSRATAALLRTTGVRVEAVTDRSRWADPGHVLHAVHPWSALEASLSRPAPAEASGVDLRSATGTNVEGDDAGPDVDQARATGGGDDAGAAVDDLGAEGDDEWRRTWQSAAAQLHRRIDAELAKQWPADAADPPTGPALAHALLAALPDDATLFLGSSNSARDVEIARGPRGPFVAGSRGLAGIDGCVSTAAGIALGPASPTYALVGDLTFLHDANGLLIGPGEPAPDLMIVVADDRGGGIFATLEYGEPTRRDADPSGYERVFATPTQVDLAALCAAHGVAYTRVERSDALAAAVSRRPRGLSVVHVPIQRDTHRDTYAALRALAAGHGHANDRR